ncbi:MAG: FAD binding domain-containing protein [Nostocoides sp.]
MKPAPFAYHAPTSVAEAVEVLRTVGQHRKVLAGGQSLIPILSMRLASPEHLVDINGVVGLDRIEVRDDCVRVGALVRHAQLQHDEAAYAVLPLLRQALVNVAHPAIRNRGTTVGSIAHADAAGEMPAILTLTSGVVEAVGPSGARDIPASEFFLGPLETALGADELAVAARFGRFPEGTRTGFAESARRSGDYALAGVAIAITVQDDVIQAARASFVSVTDVPDVLDLTAAIGVHATAPDLDAVGEAVRAHVAPDTDIHATGDYRRMLVAELTRRLVTEVLTR